jgi:hypothetical protein
MRTASKLAIHTPLQLMRRGRVLERKEMRKKRRQKRQSYKYYCQKRN